MSAFRGPDTEPHFSVRFASTANLGLSGTGAVDGVTPVVGDRALAKDQSTASGNGLYVVQSGAWTRPQDFGGTGLFQQDVPSGHRVVVSEGTANGGSEWVNTNTGLIVPGTTGLTYKRFDGAWDEWETLFAANSIMVSAGVVGNYVLKVDGSVAVVASGSTTGASAVFPLDPAQYAVTGKTIQCRVIGHVLALGTAPLSTMNFNLFPISSVSSGVPTLGASSGSSGTVVAPAINTMTPVYGTAFTMPAAGTYCLVCVTTTATNAATQQQLRAALQVRAI